MARRLRVQAVPHSPFPVPFQNRPGAGAGSI